MELRSNDQFKENQSTHVLMRNLLTISQCCGIFPIHGVRNHDPKFLKFRWISWKTFLTIFLAICSIGSGIITLLNAVPTNRLGVGFMIRPLIHFQVGATLLSSILIAKNWKAFVLEICEVEKEIFKRYKKPINIPRKVNIIFIVLIITGICEQALPMARLIHERGFRTMDEYLEYQYRGTFAYIPYHFAIGFGFWMHNWLLWLTWIIGDTFVISLATILSSRIRQISFSLENRLEHPRFKILVESKSDNEFYSEIRQDYNRLSSVYRTLNGLLSNIITVIYFNNNAFILVQIFNTLREMETQFQRITFLFSFIYVIARVVALSIYAASINEESRRFLQILNRVTSDPLNKNVEILINQIRFDALALTGHNFFKITKGLVPKIAAAIISYELVLIQFSNLHQ